MDTTGDVDIPPRLSHLQKFILGYLELRRREFGPGPVEVTLFCDRYNEFKEDEDQVDRSTVWRSIERLGDRGLVDIVHGEIIVIGGAWDSEHEANGVYTTAKGRKIGREILRRVTDERYSLLLFF